MKFENVSNSAIESVDIDKSYEKAVKFFDETSPRINPMDEEFVEKYGKEEIKKDLKYVEDMEDKFSKNDIKEQKEVNKLAIIFEAIVANEIYFSEWLGSGADATVSSRYDDIKNGVDVIVERDNDDEKYHLALALDVTFGQDVNDKFNKIKKEIDTGELTEVKYFSHDSNNIKIGLNNIPRVVIGADVITVKELSELWMSGDKRTLGEHKIQIQILEEIELQLKTFKDYARNIGRIDIADKYDKTLKIINRIISEKIDISSEGIAEDRVFSAIRENMRNFN